MVNRKELFERYKTAMKEKRTESNSSGSNSNNASSTKPKKLKLQQKKFSVCVFRITALCIE